MSVIKAKRQPGKFEVLVKGGTQTDDAASLRAGAAIHIGFLWEQSTSRQFHLGNSTSDYERAAGTCAGRIALRHIPPTH